MWLCIYIYIYIIHIFIYIYIICICICICVWIFMYLYLCLLCIYVSMKFYVCNFHSNAMIMSASWHCFEPDAELKPSWNHVMLTLNPGNGLTLTDYHNSQSLCYHRIKWCNTALTLQLLIQREKRLLWFTGLGCHKGNNSRFRDMKYHQSITNEWISEKQTTTAWNNEAVIFTMANPNTDTDTDAFWFHANETSNPPGLSLQPLHCSHNNLQHNKAIAHCIRLLQKKQNIS